MKSKQLQVHKLTQQNASNFFRKYLARGDIFTYSEAFDLESVMKLALREGWLVNYQPPGTKEYEEHGCFTCRALYRV